MTGSLVRFSDAGDMAVAAKMQRDERVVLMGTNPPRLLESMFGGDRVIRMPISEAAFTGMAVGAAASGLRPIVMWRNATFSFVAFDQVANQVSKLRYMSGGQVAFPVLFRAYGGGGLRMAAQHSQLPHAIYAHLPGLKVIAPATSASAYGLISAALEDSNPVISIEASSLDQDTEEIVGEEYKIPLGTGELAKEGQDVTVVAIGAMRKVALEAAERLDGDGISVEVIDPRSLVPLDEDLIRGSVQKTGHLVVVDESSGTCSMATEIVTRVVEHEETYRALVSAPVRVCSAPVPVPYSPPLEDAVLPNSSKVRQAIEKALSL